MRLARLTLHEMGRTAMQPRTYWVRTLYAAALATAVALAWAWREGELTHWFQRELLGVRLFEVLSWTQLALALAAALLSLSGTVADERRAGTLPLLLTSPLSGLEIVTMKFVAGWVPILLLLLVGVPILVVVTAFGGVSTGQVLGVYALTVAAVAVAASAALLFSSVVRNVAIAILGACGWLMLYAFLPKAILGIDSVAKATGATPMAVHRMLAAVVDGTLAPVDSGPLLAVALAGGLTLLALRCAAALVRRETRARGGGPTEPRSASELYRRAIREPGGRLDPLVLLGRTRTRHRRTRRLWAGGWLLAALVLLALGAARPVERWGTLPLLLGEHVLPLALLLGQAYLVLLGSALLHAERTGRLLDVILSSPLETADLWRGRIRVTLRRYLAFVAPVWCCVAALVAVDALPLWAGTLSAYVCLTDALALLVLSAGIGFAVRREAWGALAGFLAALVLDLLLYGVLVLGHTESDLDRLALGVLPLRLWELWTAGWLDELPASQTVHILLLAGAVHAAGAVAIARVFPRVADRLIGRGR